eukprot:464933-Amphidinium_carterae.1
MHLPIFAGTTCTGSYRGAGTGGHRSKLNSYRTQEGVRTAVLLCQDQPIVKSERASFNDWRRLLAWRV